MRLLLLLCFLYAGQMMAQTTETGLATYYNDKYHGRNTASGEKYDKEALTAAHKTLPFGTKVRVTRIDGGNSNSVVVKINDRGPFHHDLIIDLSRAAAEPLGLVKDGKGMVKMEVLTPMEEPKKEEVKKKPEGPNFEVSNMETEGLYKIQVLKVEQRGFGVQVATYTNYDSVLKQVAVLQNNWFKNILVYVAGTGDDASYKVVLGPFLDEATADSYKANIKKKYKIEGFVVNLNNLK
jgi:rare lipoprotein A